MQERNSRCAIETFRSFKHRKRGELVECSLALVAFFAAESSRLLGTTFRLWEALPLWESPEPAYDFRLLQLGISSLGADLALTVDLPKL